MYIVLFSCFPRYMDTDFSCRQQSAGRNSGSTQASQLLISLECLISGFFVHMHGYFHICIYMCVCKSVWVCVQPYIRGIPLTVLFWVFSMGGEPTNQQVRLRFQSSEWILGVSEDGSRKVSELYTSELKSMGAASQMACRMFPRPIYGW